MHPGSTDPQTRPCGNRKSALGRNALRGVLEWRWTCTGASVHIRSCTIAKLDWEPRIHAYASIPNRIHTEFYCSEKAIIRSILHTVAVLIYIHGPTISVVGLQLPRLLDGEGMRPDASPMSKMTSRGALAHTPRRNRLRK